MQQKIAVDNPLNNLIRNGNGLQNISSHMPFDDYVVPQNIPKCLLVVKSLKMAQQEGLWWLSVYVQRVYRIIQ